MSINEYYLYSHGYFLRFNRNQEPFRRLYKLLWNINTKDSARINSEASLYNHWPLSTDPVDSKVITKQDMIDRWNRVQEKQNKNKQANGG